jgi:hypothetical protein
MDDQLTVEDIARLQALRAAFDEFRRSVFEPVLDDMLKRASANFDIAPLDELIEFIDTHGLHKELGYYSFEARRRKAAIEANERTNDGRAT